MQVLQAGPVLLQGPVQAGLKCPWDATVQPGRVGIGGNHSARQQREVQVVFQQVTVRVWKQECRREEELDVERREHGLRGLGRIQNGI